MALLIVGCGASCVVGQVATPSRSTDQEQDDDLDRTTDDLPDDVVAHEDAHHDLDDAVVGDDDTPGDSDDAAVGDSDMPGDPDDGADGDDDDPPPQGSSGCGRTPGPLGTSTQTVVLPVRQHGGGFADTERSYEVRVGGTYDENAARAVVFLFHGAGGQSSFGASTGLPTYGPAVAAAIFVSPQGVLHPDWMTFGNGWDGSCDGYDMPFFDAMLDQVASAYCIDRSRVFVTGFSWGGDFANSVGCCRGNDVRAVANASGGEMLIEQPRAECATPVPAYRITYADNDAYPEGGFTDVLGYYRSANHCSATSSDAGVSNPNGTCKTYEDCDHPVVACRYPGMGHSLPQPAWVSDTWAFFTSLE